MGQEAENLSNYQVIYEDCSCVKNNIAFCSKCNNSRKFAVFTEEYDKDIVSICDKCHGCGKVESLTLNGVEWCVDCGGKGYVDWLERIFKPEKKIDIYSSGASGYYGVTGLSGVSGYCGVTGLSGASGYSRVYDVSMMSGYTMHIQHPTDFKTVEPYYLNKGTSSLFDKIIKWIKNKIFM